MYPAVEFLVLVPSALRRTHVRSDQEEPCLILNINSAPTLKRSRLICYAAPGPYKKRATGKLKKRQASLNKVELFATFALG